MHVLNEMRTSANCGAIRTVGKICRWKILAYCLLLSNDKWMFPLPNVLRFLKMYIMSVRNRNSNQKGC